MSAPATSMLQTLLAGPFVTVSPKGIAFGTANPANYSSITNDGAQYGPDTSGTSTSGINEAISAVSSAGGGVVYLVPTAVFQAIASGLPVGITTQIVIPSNVAICSAMYGGEAYGPTPAPPGAYINYGGTGAPSDAILIQDSTSKCGLIGVAVIGSASNALVHRRGTRQSFLIDCYLDNTNTTGSAIINDAPSTTGNGVNNEDNTASRCYFRGVARAIGIGTNDGTQHSNNCTWWDITAEVPSGSSNDVVDGVTGGNQQFYNFYSRGGTKGAIFSGGASFTIIGGELDNTAAASTNSAQIANITGGRWVFRDLSMTAGAIVATNGDVVFENVKVNGPTGTLTIGPFTFNGGGVRVFIDAACDLTGLGSSGLVVGTAAAELFLPSQTPLWDPASLLSVTGSGVVYPDNMNSPAAPSSKSFPYTNSTHNLQLAIIWTTAAGTATISLNGTAVGGGTGPWFLIVRYNDQITFAGTATKSLYVYNIT